MYGGECVNKELQETTSVVTLPSTVIVCSLFSVSDS